MLVCLIGVWCLCLRRPPRGFFFSCENGCSHDACLLALIAAGHLQSEKASTSGISAWWCAVMAVQLCVAVDIQLVVLSWCVRHRKVETSGVSIWERVASFFVYCPSMWYHLFPGWAECVWKLLCCSLWLCYGRLIPRARRRGRNNHTPDSRPVCCVKSGDSSGFCRWDVLYW